ncbi:hypothetical protein MferCBS31731_001116 [Microsporum ferrugineum]
MKASILWLGRLWPLPVLLKRKRKIKKLVTDAAVHDKQCSPAPGHLQGQTSPQPEDHLLAEDPPQPELVEAELPKIYRLNDDIIYYLATSILPLDDAAAFALTCRATYQATNGKKILQKLKLEPVRYRAQFLQRLELDFPGHVLCYLCAEFHSRLYGTWTGTELTRCDGRSKMLEISMGWLFLRYRHAKEIVNHYRLGPRYGRSEVELLPLEPHVKWRPDTDITHIIQLSVKCLDNVGDFDLVFRRNVRVEYNSTRPESRDAAIFACYSDSLHLWVGYEGKDLEKELLPTCYRCEMCGAERQFSVNYLPRKPGYAVLRSTLWESVGHCDNSNDGLWGHICHDGFPATRHEYLPISQSDLIYQRAFIDEMPAIPSKGFHDTSFRKLGP